MTNRVDELLKKKKPATNPQEIIRGGGIEAVLGSPPAPQATKPATPERQSVRIRKDLLKKCKRLALEQETTLGELIEGFIEAGLKDL